MEILKKIISIIVLIIVIPILFINIVILVDSVIHPDEIPDFFGYKPFIVLSGSMKPEINAGDLALTKEVQTSIIKENDIISYKDNELVITHRVVDIVYENGEKHFITKGDNNDMKDPGYVLENQIEGIYIDKVSGLGNVAMFIQTPTGIIISLSIPLAILICIHLAQSQKSDNEIKENEKDKEELKKEIERLRNENAKLKK